MAKTKSHTLWIAVISDQRCLARQPLTDRQAGVAEPYQTNHLVHVLKLLMDFNQPS